MNSCETAPLLPLYPQPLAGQGFLHRGYICTIIFNSPHEQPCLPSNLISNSGTKSSL